MTKRLLILTLFALTVFAATAIAGDQVATKPIENNRILTGDEPLPDMQAIPLNPGLILDSPGTVIGTTEYDYQSNGTSGNRMALDTDGGRHFVWMNGSGGSYPPPNRAVYFNYRDNRGTWLVPEVGQNISQVNGDGYTQMTLTSDNRAAVAYHSANSNFVIYAEDNFPGLGIFSYFNPPDMLGLRCYWPYLSVDRSDHIHIVMCENAPNAGDPQTLGYTRSVDGGQTWSTLARVDTLEDISQMVVSSPVSDKVAIVYSHPYDINGQYPQWLNDIFYVESTDGVTWDFRNSKINVTDYGNDDLNFWAYTDLSAIYDYNDNLNIIWPAPLWSSNNDTLYYETYLWHYSTGSGVMSVIDKSDSLWINGCDSGVWNLLIAKPSIGVDASNNLFAVYTSFDTSDCAANGYANGDLYMNYSSDGGANWQPRVNMTDSHTPGCQAGDCDSDHWSTVADRVDDSLHVTYINDKDAGGIPQTEGSLTVNPVMYMTYPNPAPTAVDGDIDMPKTFALAQNYPNPFNARTNINFTLNNASNVELTVYDITGAKVTTLLNKRLEAGQHSVNWDAGTVASGVYYYKLNANGEESTKKMTLLK